MSAFKGARYLGFILEYLSSDSVLMYVYVEKQAYNEVKGIIMDLCNSTMKAQPG